MFAEIVLIDYSRPLSVRAKQRKSCGPYRWRPSKPGNGRGFYSGREALTMDKAGSSIDLRLEWANDHLTGRLSHTSGYFADRYGEGDTLQPIIARLPHGRGFLSGWTMGGGMCGSIDGHVWGDPEDAARAAHDLAEGDAERNRDAEEEEEEEGSEGE